MRLGLEHLEDRCVPANFNVTDLGDAGPNTLRAAITAVNGSGDQNNTITITPTSGTITLESALDTISKNVTITGPGSANFAVQRDPGQQALFRIFQIAANAHVSISGMEITGGKLNTSDGGGIYNDGSLMLNGDEVDSNTSNTWNGGGIYNSSTGALTLVTTDVRENMAFGPGGGIYNAGTLNLQAGDNIFLNQTTNSNGGGIYNDTGGTVSITGAASIWSNISGLDGGGIYNKATLNWTGSGGQLTGNTAAYSGGGIFNLTGTAALTGVSISGGNSAKYGGGFFVQSGTLNLNTCTISGNQATGTGGAAGGMWETPGSYTTANCTITDAIAQYTP